MGNGGNYLLRRTRLCEADPSPGLWPPPFGLKVRRLNGQAKRLTYAKLECPMQDIHLQGGTCLRLFFNYEITNKHAAFCGSDAEPQLSNLSLLCRPLEKGRGKAAGWIDGIAAAPPLES